MKKFIQRMRGRRLNSTLAIAVLVLTLIPQWMVAKTYGFQAEKTASMRTAVPLVVVLLCTLTPLSPKRWSQFWRIPVSLLGAYVGQLLLAIPGVMMTGSMGQLSWAGMGVMLVAMRHSRLFTKQLPSWSPPLPVKIAVLGATVALCVLMVIGNVMIATTPAESAATEISDNPIIGHLQTEHPEFYMVCELARDAEGEMGDELRKKLVNIGQKDYGLNQSGDGCVIDDADWARTLQEIMEED